MSQRKKYLSPFLTSMATALSFLPNLAFIVVCPSRNKRKTNVDLLLTSQTAVSFMYNVQFHPLSVNLPGLNTYKVDELLTAES